MVDPRIYRGAWVLVFIALVVAGFSLRDGPGGETPVLPPGIAAPDAGAEASALASHFGTAPAGSAGDGAQAAAVARALGAAGGFTVSTRTDVLQTPRGARAVSTVEASRPGLGQGDIVVVADRDAALQPLAAVSGTAELISLARFFAGTTLSRSLVLVSTAGRDGASGASVVARALAGSGVDAVVALGDLAARPSRDPIVHAWAGGDTLAPPPLTATVIQALRSGTGLHGLAPSFIGQVGRLVFPYLSGPQAPFGGVGLPAVGVTLDGGAAPSATEATDPTRITAVGLAVDSAVSALDHGAAVGAPSSYLVLDHKIIPIWAVRLLVLALLAPVACSLVDATARARRRGHSVLSWIVWTLSGALPLLIGLVVLRLAGLSHLLHAPPGPVAGGAPFGLAGAGTLLLCLLAVVAGFRFVRPIGVSAASGIGWRRSPETPPVEAAVVAVAIVLCGLALAMWLSDPFTALLFVPALHLWLWLAAPALSTSRLRSLVVIVAGLVLPGIALLATMESLALAPWTFLWDLALSLAGGGIGIVAGVMGALVGGVLAGALILVGRAAGRGEGPTATAITVRGPLGYAGPGSLGGTESAIRR